jgi:hypothetical protein
MEFIHCNVVVHNFIDRYDVRPFGHVTRLCETRFFLNVSQRSVHLLRGALPVGLEALRRRAEVRVGADHLGLLTADSLCQI